MDLEKLINRYGRTVHSVDSQSNGIERKKCFIQALRYKNKMYIEGTPTDIGMNDSGYYLLIAPASMQIEKIGDKGYICDGEKKYHIDRWEKIWFGEKVFFIWAVLKEHTQGCYPHYDHFAERR